jgi:hypothetical protein
MLTRSAAARQDRHPQADEAFRQGFLSVFRQWTALELAINHSWGGHNSQEKATRVVEEIFQLFYGPDRVYKDVCITLLLIIFKYSINDA